MDSEIQFGEKPIDRLIGPIVRFMHVEAASGVVLLALVIAGLVAGKPLGIMLFSRLAVRLGLTSLPEGLN